MSRPDQRPSGSSSEGSICEGGSARKSPWGDAENSLEVLDRTAATAMAGAVRDALAEAGTNQREPGPALDRLVESLHSSRGWAALLTPGDDAEGLAEAIRPALDSGSLLAHPDTYPARLVSG